MTNRQIGCSHSERYWCERASTAENSVSVRNRPANLVISALQTSSKRLTSAINSIGFLKGCTRIPTFIPQTFLRAEKLECNSQAKHRAQVLVLTSRGQALSSCSAIYLQIANESKTALSSS